MSGVHTLTHTHTHATRVYLNGKYSLFAVRDVCACVCTKSLRNRQEIEKISIFRIRFGIYG